MVSFGPLTKMPAGAPAGGTTLFRVAELESPLCQGLLEAGGGDAGPIGSVRTSLWLAGADMAVPVLEYQGLPRPSPSPSFVCHTVSASTPAPTSQVSFSF